MEALCLVSSWSHRTSWSGCQRRQRRHGVGDMAVVRASHRWGKLVDENMIVLRQRIREVEMTEKKEEEEDGRSEDDHHGMMKWEGEYYEGEYGEHVCEVLGLLQSYLMSVRPCFAIGMAVLVALSVFMSTGLVLFNSFNMINTTLFSSLSGLS